MLGIGRQKLYRQLHIVELVIAIFLFITLIVIALQMAIEVWSFYPSHTAGETFEHLLASVSLLVIGVEFIQILCAPSAKTVLEVVMLTISRALIINHSSMLLCLLGTLSLGVVFAIRKYFFHEGWEKDMTFSSVKQGVRNHPHPQDRPNYEDTFESAQSS